MDAIAMSNLVAEAKAGRDIIVVSDTNADRHSALKLSVSAGLLADAARVHRSVGDERATFPNGHEIHFANRNGLRGRAADLVYIDGIKASSDTHVLDDAWLAVAASPHGEVINAWE